MSGYDSLRKTGYVDFTDTTDSSDPRQSFAQFDLPLEDHNVVVSQSKEYPEMHFPVLDIDVEHVLVPSSTFGHSHLYFNVGCRWEDYVEFLQAAAKIGILEEGYVNSAIERGYTTARLPWVKKFKSVGDE